MKKQTLSLAVILMTTTATLALASAPNGETADQRRARMAAAAMARMQASTTAQNNATITTSTTAPTASTSSSSSTASTSQLMGASLNTTIQPLPAMTSAYTNTAPTQILTSSLVTPSRTTSTSSSSSAASTPILPSQVPVRLSPTSIAHAAQNIAMTSSLTPLSNVSAIRTASATTPSVSIANLNAALETVLNNAQTLAAQPQRVPAPSGILPTVQDDERIAREMQEQEELLLSASLRRSTQPAAAARPSVVTTAPARVNAIDAAAAEAANLEFVRRLQEQDTQENMDRLRAFQMQTHQQQQVSPGMLVDEEDLELARRLQAENTPPSPNILTPEERASIELAQRLQGQEWVRVARPVPCEAPSNHYNGVALAPLQRIFAQMTDWRGSAQDVHVFNARIVRQHLATVTALERSLLSQNPLNLNIPLTAIMNDIRAHLSRTPQRYHSVANTLALLQNYIAQAPVDPETGMNVATYFARVWALTMRLGNTPICVTEDGTRQTALEQLIDSLAENIDTGGGCFPGIAGRTFRDYVMRLNALTQMQR